jgi:hypothetical protein
MDHDKIASANRKKNQRHSQSNHQFGMVSTDDMKMTQSDSNAADLCFDLIFGE